MMRKGRIWGLREEEWGKLGEEEGENRWNEGMVKCKDSVN